MVAVEDISLLIEFTQPSVITVAVHVKREVGTGLARRSLKEAGL